MKALHRRSARVWMKERNRQNNSADILGKFSPSRRPARNRCVRRRGRIQFHKPGCQNADQRILFLSIQVREQKMGGMQQSSVFRGLTRPDVAVFGVFRIEARLVALLNDDERHRRVEVGVDRPTRLRTAGAVTSRIVLLMSASIYWHARL